MIRIEPPGRTLLQIEHIVCDMNGTLAVDGAVSDEVKENLGDLAKIARVHIITADTFGKARREFADLPIDLFIFRGAATAAKAAFVRRLGAQSCAAIGNGRNDEAMLRAAALSIVVMGPEGAAVPTLLEADIVAPSPEDALALLLHPKRIVATLRA